MRGGSARKRYLFQASGTSKGRDFTKWSIWKRSEICHTGVYTGQKSLHMHFMAGKKSRKRPGLYLLIHLNNVGKHSWFTTVRHLIHFTKLSDYTPNLPHLDYRRIPHLVKMFKRNLLKQYQEYCSKNLNKDKFDSSVGSKLSLYSELKTKSDLNLTLT